MLKKLINGQVFPRKKLSPLASWPRNKTACRT